MTDLGRNSVRQVWMIFASEVLALASPATEYGEESKPRNTLNKRKKVEASRAT
jgi:hypothetical protein